MKVVMNSSPSVLDRILQIN